MLGSDGDFSISESIKLRDGAGEMEVSRATSNIGRKKSGNDTYESQALRNVHTAPGAA